MSVYINVRILRKQMSKSEKLAFAFACYGYPSLSEVKKFCHVYDLNHTKILKALRSLSRKGLIRIIKGATLHHSPSLYVPIFFELGDAGNRLFQLNRSIIISFLSEPRLFSGDYEKAIQMLLENFDENQLDNVELIKE